jgi:hypothetical protein
MKKDDFAILGNVNFLKFIDNLLQSIKIKCLPKARWDIEKMKKKRLKRKKPLKMEPKRIGSQRAIQ